MGAAAVSGLALGLARPPVDLGPLALVALVPLFVVWRDRAPGGRALLAFVAGVAYHAVLVAWAWYFGPIALVPFVVALSAYWAAAGAIIGGLAARGVQSPWLTAVVWVLAEATVARVPFSGFSWGEVGFALHDIAPARAVASVGGVALVTFLTVAVNGLLADLFARPSRTHVRFAAAGIATAFAVTAAAVVVRSDPTPVAELRVAIVQGNDKNRDLTAAEKKARYLPNSHFALEATIDEPVDLVIFPESSMDEDPRTDTFIRDRIRRVARQRDAWVLANATVDGPDAETEARNLNLLYTPDGTLAGTYAKRHLVPFGEYVPFDWLRDIVPALDDEIPRDYVPGATPGDFHVAEVALATVICFESAFGHEVRPLVADGAEVLVVSTNNRSYRRSANSAQHVALGQMRAAETGRPVVHASISGISAFIDADGDVQGTTALFERTVLTGTVTATRGETLYVRFGEWVVLASVLTLGATVAGLCVRGRRQRSVHLEADAQDQR
ncbi:MAG: apolipoprotein N-acyltransferase [Actinomycetota bacterium]